MGYQEDTAVAGDSPVRKAAMDETQYESNFLKRL